MAVDVKMLLSQKEYLEKFILVYFISQKNKHTNITYIYTFIYIGFIDISSYKREATNYEHESLESIIEDSDQSSTELKPIIVKSYTMINNNRMEVTVITWGASIVSLKCPDKFGHSTDIVLGFDDLKSTISKIKICFVMIILSFCFTYSFYSRTCKEI